MNLKMIGVGKPEREPINVPEADIIPSAQVSANAHVGGSFVVEPELPIGTEFWFLWNGKMEMGLVAAYHVHVTSCVEDDSWHRQLFRRWLNKKAKDVWSYSFNYEVKLDMSISSGNRIEKKKDGWYFLNRRIYF